MCQVPPPPSWVAWAIDCVSLGPRLLIAGKRTQPVRWPQVLRRRCQALCLAKRHSEGAFPGPLGLGLRDAVLG